MGIPNYNVDFERQYEFTQIGTITEEQAALGVDGRDNASVVALADAKKVLFIPEEGTPAIEVRLRTDGSNDNAFTVYIYASRGADYYVRVATLACIQGTQDWTSGHLVDSITISDEKWDHGVAVDLTANEIGRFYMNLGGYDRVLFISDDITDDDITTLSVDIARVDHRISRGT